MSGPSGPLDPIELHAFIDDELPAARAAELARLIAADPDLARQVEAFRADKAALARAYGPLLMARVPAGLVAASRQPPGAMRSRRAVGIVAGLALAAAVAFAVVLVRPPGAAQDPAVAEALAARDGAQRPSRAFRFATGDTAADAVIAAVIGGTVRAPDLRRGGFDLVGIDVYAAPHDRAIQLRYRDGRDRLFTVYLRPPAGPDGFQLVTVGTTRLCVWQNADLAAVMGGAMPTPELFRLSSLAYTALAL